MFLRGKVALVTGSNRGIGKVIALTFLKYGIKKIYLAVRDINSVKDLVSEYGERVIPLHFDLQNQESIKKSAEIATYVQILVNNAGILRMGTILDINAEKNLEEEFMINTLGVLRVARAFSSILEKNNSSAFIQMNSIGSIKNFTPLTTYSASKAASYSITQGIKEVFRPMGIKVISVHPGPILTDMAIISNVEDRAVSPQIVAEHIVKALEKEDFHLFPDPIARDFENAYLPYANIMNII